MNKRNIVLVGFMGTGKSTVGRLLAARLGMTFLDMDTLIEEREQKKISRIFADQGEPHFRALERSLARELSEEQGLVIAAGGGIVMNPENIADLSRAGLVVCLCATPEELLKRISGEGHRPLLEGDDKSARIIKILESRRQLYAAIPQQIDTTALSPDQVADRIVEMAG